MASLFSSISILLNPAKFHAKYVPGKSSGLNRLQLAGKKDCLTCPGNSISILPNPYSRLYIDDAKVPALSQWDKPPAWLRLRRF